MRVIVTTALKEKIRRKELYIIVTIGLLIILMIITGTGSISIDGVPVTAYKNIVPVLLVVTNVFGGALAIALSLRTIPNEYDRKTSHLIWMRGVSQLRYHSSLAAANALISEAAVVPDLNGIQSQAANMILGNAVNAHVILKSILVLYLITWLFVLLKRREA